MPGKKSNTRKNPTNPSKVLESSENSYNSKKDAKNTLDDEDIAWLTAEVDDDDDLRISNTQLQTLPDDLSDDESFLKGNF